ncbi:hypothetical protein M758_8G047100 [Ceratodon purpureus]|uniref:Cytochrome P450 n=1 Tax=Ceratodon purpureus TaxID=3225 RepID=A0A8T0GVF6_CERPU|nr:hypothetical protein KC19_8G048900 [Ceratodon purpureus]KAG0563657.1 hypothetical protein KC19_8G048900 [Ceratodon purpureus]KAG0607672.1 hypothetical protein M758_8G047100 [Ceratodon purpureus]KAG0607677.1 hypothetical protein M758_8G047100 [Ceratodon purpureus]
MKMEGIIGQVEQLAGKTEWAAVGVALVAVVVGLVLWKCSSGLKRVTPPVPPGSLGWPVLGETLELLSAKRANIADQFYKARVAKYGEVFKTHLFLDPVVSVGGADGNKFLFSNENKLVQNSWPPSMIKILGKDTIINQVGERHRKLRRIFTSNFFNPEGIALYVSRMDAITRDHIAKHWEGKDSILGVPTVREFTYSVAADIFMSLRETDPRYRALSQTMEDVIQGVLQVPINLPGTVYHKGWVGRGNMNAILDTLISERKQELEQGKASSKKDLLTMMLTTPNEDGIMLNDDQMKDNVNNMLFAGHETSSSTMAVALKYLYLNPECLKKVLQEQREIAKDKNGAPLDYSDTRKMKYTWQVVQETLRLQPPVQQAFRTALQNFQYAGYTILKGWKVSWASDRSHLDPKYFPNPEKFDPSRFEGSGPPPYVYIPFGGGPHICLGNEFARTVIMVFLHHIVLNFEWKLVDPDETICIDPLPIFSKSLALQIQKRPQVLAA